MADANGKLVDNVMLTLVARIAIIAATAIGLPVAGWMMNRAVSSVDSISEKIDKVREQAVETNGTIKLLQQLQTADHQMLSDHEFRLRGVEQASRAAVQR
jgi:hypothetical protein